MKSQKSILLFAIVIFIIGSGLLVFFFINFRTNVSLDSHLSETTRVSIPTDVDTINIDDIPIDLTVTPKKIEVVHRMSVDSCPHVFDQILRIEGPRFGSWVVDQKSIPEWLTVVEKGGTFPGTINGISFQCNVLPFEPQILTAQLNIQARNEVGQAVDQTFFDIVLEIIE